jgi:hypothetical protein
MSSRDYTINGKASNSDKLRETAQPLMLVKDLKCVWIVRSEAEQGGGQAYLTREEAVVEARARFTSKPMLAMTHETPIEEEHLRDGLKITAKHKEPGLAAFGINVMVYKVPLLGKK